MSSSSPVGIQQCQDFLMFQSALRNMRLLDDKIIYALNTSIPTTSFKDKVNASEQCQVLRDKVKNTHELRGTALKTCISHYQDKVMTAKNENNRSAQRQAQMHLRLFQNEMSVEEIVGERTESMLYQKCRDHLDLSDHSRTTT